MSHPSTSPTHKIRYVKDTRIGQYSGMITFCPGYPGNQTVSHFASRKINGGTKKTKIKQAMDESILREGVRNPVIAYSVNNTQGPTLLLHFGGTRWRSIERLNLERGADLPLPAIVYDAIGYYESEPEVTEDNYKDFFTDVPRYFSIDYQRDYAPLDSHYSIRAKDYARYDPAGIEWLGDDPLGVIEDELQKVRLEKTCPDASEKELNEILREEGWI